MWRALQTNRFARTYKKLSPNQRGCVNAAVAEILLDPFVGQQKKADLQGLYVHKFQCQSQLVLLGYTFDDQVHLVYLEAVGSHQNFYRDLK